MIFGTSPNLGKAEGAGLGLLLIIGNANEIKFQLLLDLFTPLKMRIAILTFISNQRNGHID